MFSYILVSSPPISILIPIVTPHFKKILLFYQAKTDLKSIIGKKVRSSLPKYMYPGKYYRLEQMPHNANGKIDRRLLKEKTMSMEKK